MSDNANITANITNTQNTIATKADIRRLLANKFDCARDAAEFIAGIDRQHRHAARVDKAIATAIEAANGDKLIAAAILGMDMTIPVTDRIFPLAGLGKGRRFATDGGAWSAAIQTAYNILSLGGIMFSPTPEGLAVDYTNKNIKTETSSKICPPNIISVTWQIAICQHALWQLGHKHGIVQTMPPEYKQEWPKLLLDGEESGGGIKQWGECLNYLSHI